MPKSKKQKEKMQSLAITYPELVKEWDYEKNYPLTPEDVTAGSQQKVYWKLHYYDRDKGKYFDFEWSAKIANRNRGVGCPYLNGEIWKGFNDLATTNSELVENEWDYEKNAPLLPIEVSKGSHQKVWWKCLLGHSYTARIYNKTLNHSTCPICDKQNRTSLPEQAIFYYLKQFYSDTINGDTDAIGMEIDVYVPSIKLAIEYDGYYHNKQRVKSKELEKNELCHKNGINLIRIRIDGLNVYSDCYCIVHKNTNDYKSIDTLLIDLFSHLGLPINDINIERDVYKIQKSYLQKVIDRSIIAIRPDLLQEWDSNKNANINPKHVYAGSSVKYWWKCPKGHSYSASPGNRTCKNPSGCPTCKKEKLREILSKPVYCIEIDKTFKSLKEASITVGVHRSSITNNINGKTKYAGQIPLEDGTKVKLHWKWA